MLSWIQISGVIGINLLVVIYALMAVVNGIAEAAPCGHFQCMIPRLRMTKPDAAIWLHAETEYAVFAIDIRSVVVSNKKLFIRFQALQILCYEH